MHIMWCLLFSTDVFDADWSEQWMSFWCQVLSATAEDDDDQHQLVYADLAPDAQPKIQQLKDVQQLQDEDVKYVEIEKA